MLNKTKPKISIYHLIWTNLISGHEKLNFNWGILFLAVPLWVKAGNLFWAGNSSFILVHFRCDFEPNLNGGQIDSDIRKVLMLVFVRFCLIFSNFVQYCLILSSLVQFCLILSDFIWFCSILCILSNFVWFCPVLSDLAWFRPILFDLVHFYLSSSNLVWFCTCLSDFVRLCPTYLIQFGPTGTKISWRVLLWSNI